VEILSEYHGLLLEPYCGLNIFITLVVLTLIGFWGLGYWAWAVAITAALFLFGAPLWLLIGFIAISLVFVIKPLRKVMVSGPLMKLVKAMNILPKISDTEKAALDAGVVWAEAELFSGHPNMKKLMDEPFPKLTEEEQAFVDGPLNELCQMIDDWKVWRTRELDDKVFDFIKKNKFLGMIIPKKYGGLEFSAEAHSVVIQKLSTRSVAGTITVMVPNSLGPAELLTHYGTQAQKDRYLKRLADGDEIPCFGLTEPLAGSDAGSMTSNGVLFKGEDGKIYIRLNWRKRYITLAAISTVIGLGFRLRDPENLLGKGENLGITCALIPATTKGVEIGRRHDPLGVPFYNCPTEGHDVVIDADECIIGGLEGAGKGWMMLMESLAAGRGISLPAQSAGGIKHVARVASAHATVRKQFGVSIGKFEGIEEPLARIAGNAYLIEALRGYTISPLDQGIKPPVVTAMAKYNTTELFRKTINDGMDILGGSGISMGPKNLIGVPYIATPISVTVEGANILTRTLMVFGQGAFRAHPFAYKEITAIETGNVDQFDDAFWGHVGHVVKNKARAFVLSITRGRLASAPSGYGKFSIYFKKLQWASASFAFVSDICMALLGGQLKFKEKLTGRLADILSSMYIATAVLRKFKEDGKRKEDEPFVEYSLKVCFCKIQDSFDEIYANFDGPWWPRVFYRTVIKWWSNFNRMDSMPSDKLTHTLSKLIQTPGEQRNRILEGSFLPVDSEKNHLTLLEEAFVLVHASESIEKKMKKAVRKKQIKKAKGPELVKLALDAKVITSEEAETLSKAYKLATEAVEVDDFSQEDYISRT
jgi:acyl-CoA dehydrogenase